MIASYNLPKDRKPTSKPSIKVKQLQRPQKSESKRTPDSESKHAGTYTTTTRSGRVTQAMDWSTIASN